MKKLIQSPRVARVICDVLSVKLDLLLSDLEVPKNPERQAGARLVHKNQEVQVLRGPLRLEIAENESVDFFEICHMDSGGEFTG
jgi:hypothetical protein